MSEYTRIEDDRHGGHYKGQYQHNKDKSYTSARFVVVDLEQQLKASKAEVEALRGGILLIESSLINLRPRDNTPIDRRFGELIKDAQELQPQGGRG